MRGFLFGTFIIKTTEYWRYSEAQEYIKFLKLQNPVIPPRFTSFDVGEAKQHHDCWTRTMDPAYKEDGKNIYEWMLSYKR